jgi:hypothetical protein
MPAKAGFLVDQASEKLAYFLIKMQILFTNLITNFQQSLMLSI